jgi:hypothetical protein
LLPADLILKRSGFTLISGHTRNPLLPETEIDPCGFSEGHGQVLVVVSCSQTQLEEGIIPVGFDLWGEHSAGGTPCLSHVAAGLENQHLSAAPSELPSTGSADCSTADDYDVQIGRHSDQ